MYTFKGSIIRNQPPQEIYCFGAARITGQAGGAFLPSSPSWGVVIMMMMMMIMMIMMMTTMTMVITMCFLHPKGPKTRLAPGRADKL